MQFGVYNSQNIQKNRISETALAVIAANFKTLTEFYPSRIVCAGSGARPANNKNRIVVGRVTPRGATMQIAAQTWQILLPDESAVFLDLRQQA